MFTAALDMTISAPDLHRSPPITLRRIGERFPWLLAGAAALAVVLGVLAAIDGGRLLVWDRPITDAVVEHRSPAVDRVALWISRLGSTPVVLMFGAVGVALAAARCRWVARVRPHRGRPHRVRSRRARSRWSWTCPSESWRYA